MKSNILECELSALAQRSSKNGGISDRTWGMLERAAKPKLNAHKQATAAVSPFSLTEINGLLLSRSAMPWQIQNRA